MIKLLSRERFRETCLLRDNSRCIICNSEDNVTVHHIIERRLFTDGGYYIDNGASLCGACHIKAETTELSVEDIKEAAGITTKILPPHMYTDVVYTKWGDTILANKTRTPGELFHDESVQKILKQGNVLDLYTSYVKYPRTYHLPWSGYIGEDDRIQGDLTFFNNEIVMTVKMDGENTTMYRDYMHARSVDGNSHWTQSWVRQLHSTIAYDIPENWRICGENLFARHSIKYNDLKSYFYIFSIWDDKNNCLSWNETVEWAELLGIPTVPVIFKGKWVERPDKIHKLWTDAYNESSNEGYVVRDRASFNYGQFRYKTGKYVRKNHVTTASHWKFDKIEQNTLIS